MRLTTLVMTCHLGKYTSDSEHPLLTDRKRLERILDVMYAKIQKTLFPRHSGQPRPRVEASQTNGTGGVERILRGTGVSADDVLGEAFLALLEFPPERLKGTWKGLAVTIAHHKAVDALRASQKGLGGTDDRPELRLVSGDVEREGPDGEMGPSLFELLPNTTTAIYASVILWAKMRERKHILSHQRVALMTQIQPLLRFY